MSENALAKAMDMSDPLVAAGMKIGEKGFNFAVEYSEVVVEVGMEMGEKVFKSVVEYSHPVIDIGRDAFEDVLNIVTTFYEENSEPINDILWSITYSLITIILVSWLTVILIISWDQYQPELVEVEEEEENDQ